MDVALVAWGACHANNPSIDEVLLVNPISTLNGVLENFETRFRYPAKILDWSDPNNDGVLCKAKGYVVYDPLFYPGRMHARRYKGLEYLKLTGVGHSMPNHLKNLGMLG